MHLIKPLKWYKLFSIQTEFRKSSFNDHPRDSFCSHQFVSNDSRWEPDRISIFQVGPNTQKNMLTRWILTEFGSFNFYKLRLCLWRTWLGFAFDEIPPHIIQFFRKWFIFILLLLCSFAFLIGFLGILTWKLIALSASVMIAIKQAMPLASTSPRFRWKFKKCTIIWIIKIIWKLVAGLTVDWLLLMEMMMESLEDHALHNRLRHRRDCNKHRLKLMRFVVLHFYFFFVLICRWTGF